MDKNNGRNPLNNDLSKNKPKDNQPLDKTNNNPKNNASNKDNASSKDNASNNEASKMSNNEASNNSPSDKGALDNVSKNIDPQNMNAMGAINKGKDGAKDYLDKNSVKMGEDNLAQKADGTKSDVQDQLNQNSLNPSKRKGKPESLKDMDTGNDSSLSSGKGGKGLKEAGSDKAKDAVKDKLKDAGKDKAKDELAKNVASSAVKAGGGGKAGVGSAVGAKGGLMAGAGLAIGLKLWGGIYNTGVALMASAPVSFIQQTVGFISSAVSSVVSFANSVISSVSGFFGGLFATTSTVPATVATTVVVGSVGGVNLASSANRAMVDDENACVGAHDPLTDVKSGTGGAVSGVTGDWTQEGTKTNKVAKEIFDYWVGKGFNGAGASGVVGNAYQESTFNPLSKQTGGETADPKTVVGKVGTNGYGLYQISPGSKYGNWSGFTESTVQNQSDYVWEGYEGARTSRGLKNNTEGTRLIATAPTPQEGAWHFYNQVENGGQKQSDYDAKQTREGVASKAYDLFGGKNYEADASIFNSSETAGANDSNSSISGALNGASDSDLACTQDSESGNIGAHDGTGSVPKDMVGQPWHWEDIPEEVKKYAYDPRKAGLHWASTEGWWKPSGQCVGFAASYFSAIWEGSDRTSRGNGNVIAERYAENMEGTLDKVPKRGAITSIKATNGGPTIVTADSGKRVFGAGGVYGHTQVVQHVFENGDFLVAEQNYPGYSGDENNTKYTWHFRVMPHQLVESGKIVFFKPDEKKYKLHWES